MLSCAFMLSAFLPISAQNNRMSNAANTEINYTVSMSKPQTHLLEVEMRVRQNGAAQNVDLIMPVWTPGSYLIREYERHVQDFAAKDASGKVLSWDKLNKNTWRIASNSANEVVVNYKVYSNELTVRTNELNSDHAFWNNAALLMYPKDNLKTPSTLKVVPFGSWKVATALEPSGTANTFRAENFDTLYDSPFEVGNFVETSFDVKGIPHRLVINGTGNYDLERLRRDIPKIIEVESQIFGATHAEVCACVLGVWGLPTQIVEAVASHHHPFRLLTRPFSPMTAVFAANILEHEVRPETGAMPPAEMDLNYLN
ncbi:MAG: HDOD domain-containing protein, partial [Pyrinomonadaceae bacterium]|nr:HDOD domain-containing protein [Pyrinomonadaceae bacterium]